MLCGKEILRHAASNRGHELVTKQCPWWVAGYRPSLQTRAPLRHDIVAVALQLAGLYR
jgi:hypothetical protein